MANLKVATEKLASLESEAYCEGVIRAYKGNHQFAKDILKSLLHLRLGSMLTLGEGFFLRQTTKSWKDFIDLEDGGSQAWLGGW